MEVNSRRVLYEEQGDLRLPMASTTKILTCITALILCENLEETVVIPKEAVGIEGSSVYLKEGEIYSVRDLLYGLMLRSGNDCATALALHLGKSIEGFAMQMNAVAQKAGAVDSHFNNPHGLPSDGHVTTARDLALITSFAMQNSTFCEIVSTTYYAPRGWKNKNKMLSLCDDAVGVKTGYTKEAGRCLVSAIKRNGMTVVCVVLGCPTTYERSIELLNDAFKAYSYQTLLRKDEPIFINDKKIKGATRRDIAYPLLNEEKSLIEIVAKPIIYSKNKLKNKEIVGQFEIYLSKRLLFSGNLYKL